jgi:DNA polymerase-3 subunit alpha
MGLCDYFLIVQEILTWAKSQGIPRGPGRGSAAGSLVSYCLEITHLDPIKYGLLFERFLNPARITSGGLADIDLDFCEDRREEIVLHLKNRYGEECISGIGTFGAMKAKGAIRDVCRTLGYEYEIGNKLADLVLPPVEGKPQPLSVCYE